MSCRVRVNKSTRHESDTIKHVVVMFFVFVVFVVLYIFKYD